MKTIENIINEGRIENLMIPDCDVKPYLDALLDKWLQSINSYSILNIQDNYNKIDLLRKCEVIIYILDKFSDDITIHFTSADKNTDKSQKIYYGYNLADRLLSVFNVIMKVMEIESICPNDGLKDGESIADEVAHLKSEFDKLVNKYNKKYNEKIENAKSNGIAEKISCDCDCKCCATCCNY